MNIGQILHKKYHEDKLSHLYLIEPQFQEPGDHCRFFVEKLITDLNVKLDHPDILFLPRTDKKSYTLENIHLIYDFIRYPALDLKRKFFIMDDAHKLNELLINKLLKEFEEPPIPITFILLNPKKYKLLPTLRSRCTLLRIPGPLLASGDLTLPLESMDVEKFGKKYLSDATTVNEFLNRLSRHGIAELKDYEALQEYQDLIKVVEKDIEYNNPLQHIQYKIYHFCAKYLMS